MDVGVIKEPGELLRRQGGMTDPQRRIQTGRREYYVERERERTEYGSLGNRWVGVQRGKGHVGPGPHRRLSVARCLEFSSLFLLLLLSLFGLYYPTTNFISFYFYI